MNLVPIILLVILIPSIIGVSYAVTEMSISRTAYSEDNYILFENEDGTDQFWVDGDGFAYANGTLLGAGGGGGFTVVYKTADEQITEDSVLTNDVDLFFSAEANSVYLVSWGLFMDAEPNSDFQYEMYGPTGHSGWVHDQTWDPDTAQARNSWQTGQALSNNGFPQHVNGQGVVIIDSTAGNVGVKWSQVTSHVDQTTLEENSWLSYIKMS